MKWATKIDKRPSQFARLLGLIVAGALVIRVVAAFWWDANTGFHGDELWYVVNARNLAHGHGFIKPLVIFIVGHDLPSAGHPPVYPAYLSVAAVAGFTSSLAFRLWSTLPGIGTVLLVGLTARDLADDAAGLLAAALAAVYVDFFAQDVGLWSEGMFIFTIALTVYASYRFIRRPDFAHAVFVGGAIALAALTRAEAALLLVFLLLPLALRARAVPFGRRLGLLAAGLGIAAVLFAPWAVYNSQRFKHPVYLSSGLGSLLVWANCPRTYNGPELGGWVFRCADTLPVTAEDTVVDLQARRTALHYVAGHLDRLPVVIPIRVLRTFGFYRPDAITAADLNLTSGRLIWVARLALVQYWAMLVAGVIGAVVLHRRRVPLLPFAAMVAIVLVITIFGYGTMRFRAALDAILPVVAAIGARALWRARSGVGDDAAVGEGSRISTRAHIGVPSSQ